jgi:hypothetical protein
LELEHYRKAAKQLLRAFRAGQPDAVRRGYDSLGERASERFQLSDAQHVVAVENGYRSWTELKHALEAAEPAEPAEPDGQGERGDTVIDTGLAYRPSEPVRLRVRRREQRLTVSDLGVALARSGRPANWPAIAERLQRDLDVNITRAGAVWLPVVPAGPPLPAVTQRIAAASLTFYQELLELAGE